MAEIASYGLDEKLLSASNAVRVWSLDNISVPYRVSHSKPDSHPRGLVNRSVWSSNNNIAVSVGAEGHVILSKVIERRSDKHGNRLVQGESTSLIPPIELRDSRGELTTLNTVAIAADSCFLYAGGNSTRLIIYCLKRHMHGVVHTLEMHQNPITAIDSYERVGHDGGLAGPRLIAVGDMMGRLSIVSHMGAKTKGEQDEPTVIALPPMSDEITMVRFRKPTDGSPVHMSQPMLCASSADGSCHIFAQEANGWTLVEQFPLRHRDPMTGEPRACSDCQFCGVGGKWLATAGGDGRVVVTDHTGAAFFESRLTHPLTCIAAAHDGRTVAVGARNGKIYVVDMQSTASETKVVSEFLENADRRPVASLEFWTVQPGRRARSTPGRATPPPTRPQLKPDAAPAIRGEIKAGDVNVKTLAPISATVNPTPTPPRGGVSFTQPRLPASTGLAAKPPGSPLPEPISVKETHRDSPKTVTPTVEPETKPSQTPVEPIHVTPKAAPPQPSPVPRPTPTFPPQMVDMLRTLITGQAELKAAFEAHSTEVSDRLGDVESRLARVESAVESMGRGAPPTPNMSDMWDAL